jgi:hypothetical protein
MCEGGKAIKAKCQYHSLVQVAAQAPYKQRLQPTKHLKSSTTSSPIILFSVWRSVVAGYDMQLSSVAGIPSFEPCAYLAICLC